MRRRSCVTRPHRFDVYMALAVPPGMTALQDVTFPVAT
jgi:hypothetical protein